MKNLKHIRVLVCVIMLVESLFWILSSLVASMHTGVAKSLQISPSLAAWGVGSTLGAALIWIIATILLGRVYCSSVCPVGTLQDVVIRLTGKTKIQYKKHFSYKKPNNLYLIILAIYIAAVVATIGFLPLLLEPWPMFVNIVSLSSLHGLHPLILNMGVGLSVGIICACVSFMLVMIYALFRGRDFCNDICPIGSVLRLVSSRTIYHIELYPDRCTSCLKCQEVCKASCIDIKTRTVDNARCIRCFNCVAVCEDDAIRFTAENNHITTPLLQRKSQLS